MGRACDGLPQLGAWQRRPAVVLAQHGPRKLALAHQLGANAVSQYAYIGGSVNGSGPEVPNHPLPYASNAAQELQHWEACKATGAEVLPCITAGWDPRPREVVPPPWSSGGAHPGCNVSGQARCFVRDPSMPELTLHTQRTVEWVGANIGGAARANAVLLSAWNEHDEGHWICPSLYLTRDEDTSVRGLLCAADLKSCRMNWLLAFI